MARSSYEKARVFRHSGEVSTRGNTLRLDHHSDSTPCLPPSARVNKSYHAPQPARPHPNSQFQMKTHLRVVRTLSIILCIFATTLLSFSVSQAQNLQREWIRTYRLEAAKTNAALKILSVPDGIVVAGSSANQSGDSDYLVIKYKANGDEAWNQ